MKRTAEEQNSILNQLWKMQDELYNTYAARSGLPLAAFWTLYSLCETEEVCTQQALADKWCFPKQTVHSAIASLVKMGYVELRQMHTARNSKGVHLTEAGRSRCVGIINPLIEAELRALLRMTEEERDLFIALSQKQYEYLQEELDHVYAHKSVDLNLEKRVKK